MAEVIVALDYPTGDEALALVDSLGPGGVFYKVGLELFSREGPDIVEELVKRGHRVFLDLKLHDIPNTVARTVAAACEFNVDFVTVHATGGVPMMTAAAKTAGGDLTLLAVTVLTSLTRPDLEVAWGRELDSIPDEVERLARLARGAGVRGVVTPAQGARALRRRVGSDLVVVTPGIRIGGDDPHDQAHVTTPADATRAGADYLVVGRSITRAQDPGAALAQVRSEMQIAVQGSSEPKA